jgi:hypothetical protein
VPVSHPSSCVEEGATRPTFLVADIVRAHGPEFQRTHVLTPDQRRALHAIAACRTAALGGHLDVCPACGYRRPSYNSCRNRHCPTCQGKASIAWVEARMQRVLPTPYFHLVFTLPEQLRLLVHRNRKRLFDLLFEAATQTLLTLAADPKHLGALIGITAVLHTWARDLGFHPHLHCVVTGGGLAQTGERWIASPRSRFLFPVQVLSALFQGKFMAGLVRIYQRGELNLGGPLDSLRDPDVFRLLKDSLYRKRWVVFAKQPFGGPKQVFSYLGLYTHRVAISNRRILAIESDTVRFRTRGKKTVTLAHAEFLRRLVLHVLPKGFVKIRHYGLLAPRHADTKLETARSILGDNEPSTSTPPTTTSTTSSSANEAEYASDSPHCPLCAHAPLLRLPIPAQRPPPPQSRT